MIRYETIGSWVVSRLKGLKVFHPTPSNFHPLCKLVDKKSINSMWTYGMTNHIMMDLET